MRKWIKGPVSCRTIGLIVNSSNERYITPGPVQRSRVRGEWPLVKSHPWAARFVHPRRVRRISVKQDLDDQRAHFITDWFSNKVSTILDETGLDSGDLWASAVFVMTWAFEISFVSVCFSDDCGHTTFPIIMKFGVNVHGTKTKRRVCEDFLISLPFQNGGRFVIFGSYIVKPLEWFSWHLISLDIFVMFWLERLAFRVCVFCLTTTATFLYHLSCTLDSITYLVERWSELYVRIFSFPPCFKMVAIL